jgi:hypothetical protein
LLQTLIIVPASLLIRVGLPVPVLNISPTALLFSMALNTVVAALTSIRSKVMLPVANKPLWLYNGFFGGMEKRHLLDLMAGI